MVNGAELLEIRGKEHSDICGYHGCAYEECCLVGCEAVQFIFSEDTFTKFLRNVGISPRKYKTCYPMKG